MERTIARVVLGVPTPAAGGCVLRLVLGSTPVLFARPPPQVLMTGLLVGEAEVEGRACAAKCRTNADEDEAPQPFFLRQIMSIVDEFGGMERSGSFMISFSDAAIPMKQVP